MTWLVGEKKEMARGRKIRKTNDDWALREAKVSCNIRSDGQNGWIARQIPTGIFRIMLKCRGCSYTPAHQVAFGGLNFRVNEKRYRNMKARCITLALFCIALGGFYFWHEAAEAARFGRGRSFGSRPSYQRSAPAPTQKPASPQAEPRQTVQQKPGVSPSPMGRWGGMLGGFLMGGLIGSLLFGGGFGTGPGLLDLVLVGGGLFMLFRFLRSRTMATQSASPGGAMSFEGASGQPWGHLNDTPPAPETVHQSSLPPGFDADEFLKGANAVYARLQNSWDKRDLEDIRQFTSPEVFSEIQAQAKEDPTPGKTEVLLVTPRIIEARDVDHQTIVSVLFDVMLRESDGELPSQVRELWHFSRERNTPGAFWVLEGIQQVER
ncbi:MAG: Tim44 domain-containing protein [Desulfobacterales bacterium]